MAKKKKASSKKGKSSSKGRPAILSVAKGRSKRPAKARVGRTRRGAARKSSAQSRVRGRRY